MAQTLLSNDLVVPRPHPSRISLKVAGLFAGIGGLELGLSSAGHEALVLCEIDHCATRVLTTRFPGLEVRPDVRTFGSLPSGTDMVVGGSPCTDFSQAGQTRGIGGDASSLVMDQLSIASSADVQWMLLENVGNMLRLKGGEGIRTIVGWLEERKFMWAYRLIDTRAFGLPQRRERVYLLASKHHDPRRVLFADDAEALHPGVNHEPAAYGFYWTEGTRGLGWAKNAVPTLKGGSTIGIPSPPAVWMPDGSIGSPNICDAERLQGFPAGWTEIDDLKRGARWKMVGNAVTVAIPEYLGGLLAETPDLRDLETHDMPASSAWPNAAFNVGLGRKAVKASTFPVAREFQPIEGFLEHGLNPLSLRAISGFYRRARASNLRFEAGFLDAVRTYVEQLKCA